MRKNPPVKLHKTNKEAGKYAGSPAKPDSGAEYAPRGREETHKNGGKQPGKNRGNVWFALDGTG